ncbi:alpha/beta hydrolase [Georgenia sp. 311]|uniref:alpha/beta fold hydrolase n=1 Tax=Georgenia sp. 311 TaxID=2585134 RepID=UPI0011125ABC|nr:alpha/beta hydrolase [Georgenia sp. 311]TNC20518.1 alpha/beta hydrolase [Georgenia sp. 311]
MATFVLVPGAGGSAWYWHLVERELRARGHTTVAVDLPADDDTAGLDAYAAAVVAAVPDGSEDLVVVAQSMGGLTAPLAADRLAVRLVVLVNAMIPRPGETGGEWWEVSGQGEAMEAYAHSLGLTPEDLSDPVVLYGHDVPPDLFAESGRRTRDQSGRPFADPWPLAAWPDVPTRVVTGSRDRLFPRDFQHRLARERLGVVPDDVEGGHAVALSRPAELAALLDRYAHEAPRAASTP